MQARAVRESWAADRARKARTRKGLAVVGMFRFGTALPSPLRWIYRPFYYLITDCIMSISLPLDTEVGPGLSIMHGQGAVVSWKAKLGADVTIMQGVTIGERRHRAPTIGDRVFIGANSTIIGGITIGDDSVVGAGAVVVDDVPPFSRVVGPRAVARPRARTQPDPQAEGGSDG
jgi:serine acetyltransferase